MPRLDITRLRKNRPIFLKLGFLFSLAFVTYAFSLEVSPYDHKSPIGELEPETIEVQIPITQQKKKQILPPPPKEQIIEPEIIEETPVFVDELIPEDIPVEIVDNPEPVDLDLLPAPAPKLKPPVAEKEIVSDIEIIKTWDWVEEMPRFPGCEDISGSSIEKKRCAEIKMMEFIYGKVKFPQLARDIGEEGTVLISFVIDKKGLPIDFEIIREPGNLLGKEALRVLRQMPKWTPGKQRGRTVNVRYKMPLKFHLE